MEKCLISGRHGSHSLDNKEGRYAHCTIITPACKRSGNFWHSWKDSYNTKPDCWIWAFRSIPCLLTNAKFTCKFVGTRLALLLGVHGEMYARWSVSRYPRDQRSRNLRDAITIIWTCSLLVASMWRKRLRDNWAESGRVKNNSRFMNLG